MIVMFAIKKNVLETAIAQRVARSFTPADVEYPNPFGDGIYIDTIRVGEVEIALSEQTSELSLNELKESTIDVANGNPIKYKPLDISVNLTVLTLLKSALEETPSQNPRMKHHGTTGKLEAALMLGTDGGNLQLNIDLKSKQFGIFSLPDNMTSFSSELPIIASLAKLRPSKIKDTNGEPIPYDSRLLNAGATLSTSGDVVFRLEFVPVAGEEPAYAPSLRRTGWTQFLNTPAPDLLNSQDWALAVPLDLVAEATRFDFDVALAAPESQDNLDYFDDAAVNVSGSTFKITASGEVPSVCLFFQPDLDITVNVSLEVPSTDIIQARVKINEDVGTAAEIACAVLDIVFFPVASIWLTVKGKIPWYATALLLPVWFSVPMLNLIAAALALIGSGFPDDIIDQKTGDQIAEKQKGKLTRVSDLEFLMAVPFDALTFPGAGKLHITEVGSFDNAAVVRGTAEVAAPIMPAIVNGVAGGFGIWFLSRSCDHEPTRNDYVAMAPVILTVTGDTADPAAPKTKYNVPWINEQGKRGIIPKIIDDPDHTYRLEPLSGVSGDQVMIYASPSNYPCKLRFVTNGGIRDFTLPIFADPPPLPGDGDPIAAALDYLSWKGQHCWAFGTKLLSGFLEVLWLPYPPEQIEFGQLWEIVLFGTQRDDRFRIFEADSSRVLVEAKSNGAPLTLSFANPAGRRMRAVQITRNEEAPLAPEAYAAFDQRFAQVDTEPALRVWQRQTPLIPLANASQDEEIGAVRLSRSADGLTAHAFDMAGQATHRLDIGGFNPVNRTPVAAPLRSPAIRNRLSESLTGTRRGSDYAVNDVSSGELIAAFYNVVPGFLTSKRDDVVAMPSSDGLKMQLYETRSGALPDFTAPVSSSRVAEHIAQP